MFEDSVINAIGPRVAQDGLSWSGDKHGLKIILARLEGHCDGADEDTKKYYMTGALRVLDAKFNWETKTLTKRDGDEEDKWEKQHRENQIYDLLVDMYFLQKQLDAGLL